MDSSKDTSVMSMSSMSSTFTNIDNCGSLRKLNVVVTTVVIFLIVIVLFLVVVFANVCGFFGDGRRKSVEFCFGDVVVLPVRAGVVGRGGCFKFGRGGDVLSLVGVVVGVGQRSDVLVVRVDNGVGVVPRYSEVRFVKSELSK
jgi:hypothetical protein